MRPLQVWLPLIGGGLGDSKAQRDAKRAFGGWKGEVRLWMLPGLGHGGSVEWKETWEGQPAVLRAMSSEGFNCVDICHVGENGFVYGPPMPGRFDGLTLDGILDAWLDWPNAGTIEWQEPTVLEIEVPAFSENEVVYRRIEIQPTPVTTVPIVKGAAGPIRFNMTGQSHQPISPENELAEAYQRAVGNLVGALSDGNWIALGTLDPTFKSRGAILSASPPLRALFPTGVNLDALYHWSKMSSVLRQSAKDPRHALKLALDWSSDYVGEGRSDFAHSWLMPTIAEVGDIKTVILRAETYGLSDASTWEEVAQSRAWKQRMTAPVPIRRAWGAIGILWALILERLENAQPIQFCERCGKNISGTRRKRFCARNDDLPCFLRRRAADRKRART